MFRNIKCKMWLRIAVMLGLFCLVLNTTGCRIGKYQIRFGKGDETETVFSFGEYRECTKEELFVYFLIDKAEYEDTFGEMLWDMQVSDFTMEEFVKNNVLTKAIYNESMSALAVSRGIELSDEQNKKAKDLASYLYASLENEKNINCDISIEDIEEVYESYLLAESIYDYLTESVDTEISDAEAKVIILQCIRCDYNEGAVGDTYEFMSKLHNELQTGKQDLLIAQYGDRVESSVIEVAKGELTQKTVDGRTLEEVVYALAEGEISELLTVIDDGYYIFISIDDYDSAKTDLNKINILEKRKNAIVEEAYNDFLNDVEYTFDTELWENIDFLYNS